MVLGLAGRNGKWMALGVGVRTVERGQGVF